MLKQTKITSFAMSRFNNALHASFHLALHEVVSALPAPDLSAWRIQPLMQNWKESIDMELEITREAQASADTLRLDELDKQRDAIIAYIFEGIKYERTLGLLDTRKQAAQRLHITSRTYRGLQREAYQEQTAQTIALLVDLRKPDNFQDLKTLGLAAYLGQLEQVNDDFRNLYSTRSATKAQTQLPTAKAQRQVSDDLYAQVRDRIHGAFLFVSSDSERERINYLVRLMNQRITDHRNRYNQATNQRGSGSGNTVQPAGTGSGTGGFGNPEAEPKADGE